MTRIRATCPSCGEVDLQPADIELRIVRANGDEISDGSTYRFACPGCDDVVQKPADERIARLLTTGGVAVSVTRIDDAGQLPPHPEGPVDGPPLTHDDLLDLHLALSRPDWFSRLAASVR